MAEHDAPITDGIQSREGRNAARLDVAARKLDTLYIKMLEDALLILVSENTVPQDIQELEADSPCTYLGAAGIVSVVGKIRDRRKRDSNDK